MKWQDWLRTSASGWVILIRLMVGLAVFFPEGIQKVIFPDILGAGRFTRIGIPFPNLMGPFVGAVESVCGALVIVALLTRFAAIPLIITMIVAIISTKDAMRRTKAASVFLHSPSSHRDVRRLANV